MNGNEAAQGIGTPAPAALSERKAVGRRRPGGRSHRPSRLLVATVVGLAAVGVLAAVVHFLVVPYNPGFVEHPWPTRVHVVLGGLYLVLAPWQLSRRVRTRHPRYHRYAGRILVSGGLLVGGSALFLGLVVPSSGNAERVVISIFGSLFLLSLVLGFARARQGRIEQHREWMLRAFAIGLSIATMRLLFIPTLLVLDDPTDTEIAWVSVAAFTAAFLVHSTVTEWWISRTRRSTAPRPPRPAELPASGPRPAYADANWSDPPRSFDSTTTTPTVSARKDHNDVPCRRPHHR